MTAPEKNRVPLDPAIISQRSGEAINAGRLRRHHLAEAAVELTSRSLYDAASHDRTPRGSLRDFSKISAMPLPNAPEARPFYQSAKQRFEDARFLLEAERTTGAIYLAGYGVECMLKALILSLASAGARAETLATFRGAQAHNYDWLKRRYFDLGGPNFPPAIAKQFTLVNTWTTDLRYMSGTAKRFEADDFLKASLDIITWADGRL